METKARICGTMLVLVLANVVGAEALSQQFVEPIRSKLENIPQGIKYVGSNNPIPDQHIKCMSYLDSYLDRSFAKLNRHTDRDADWTRSVKAKENYSKIDWGISAKIDYSDWEKQNRAQLLVERKELEEVRAELREYEEGVRKNMLKASSMTGAALATMAAAIAMGQSAVQAAREAVLYSEDQVDRYESFATFAQCVSGNGLPPTVP